MQNCGIFPLLKAVMKTRAHRNFPERGRLVQDLKAFLCVIPLLSRMRGNAIPGAPVKASMSDGYAVTRVEPWNVLHPTPDFQGCDISILSPIKKEEKLWKTKTCTPLKTPSTGRPTGTPAPTLWPRPSSVCGRRCSWPSALPSKKAGTTTLMRPSPSPPSIWRRSKQK